MHDGLGQQIVETTVVAALGGGGVDLEQRFGFGPADRLMLDRGRGQDARAPGGVIGIERAGKMDTALGGRAFAGDHAVTHNGERVGCGLSAGWFEGAVGFGGDGMVRRALNIFLPSERSIEPSPILTTRRVTPIDDFGACNVAASPSVTALPLIIASRG